MRWKTPILLGAAGLAGYAITRRLMRREPSAYFAGKSVVVTGGASGIGLALVDQLREYGARVFVADLDAAGLDDIDALAPDVATLLLDVAAPDGPRRLLDESIARLGHVDVLFSNAGVIWAAPFALMTDDDIRRLIEVNFTMQVRVTREFLPYFVERGDGIIAYTGSLSAHVYSPMHSVYTGTKGALHGFVAALRRELPWRSRVRLAVVQPSITRTGLVRDDLFDEVEKAFWLQEPGQVAEAFLRGVASGKDEIFVERMDHVYATAERFAPALVSAVFRARLADDELRERSEAAIPESKLRRQIASAAATSGSDA